MLRRMNFFSGFIAGISQVLSFGMPKSSRIPLISTRKSVLGDWQNTARDISVAIRKYEAKEGKNGKA